MTYKEGPELSYINLLVIQSPHGISIDQTAHINVKIPAQWFPNATEISKSAPTPFKEDRIFEVDLSETLPSTPGELHHLEELYLVKYSANIGKTVHIMQCTRPDLMYAVNHISRYATYPYEPALKGIKYLICYLAG